MKITRELNKKSPMYFYTIYTIDTWFMLAMNNPVVATTRHSRTNDLTTSKALSRAIK